jgi:hypothetical protein
LVVWWILDKKGVLSGVENLSLHFLQLLHRWKLNTARIQFFILYRWLIFYYLRTFWIWWWMRNKWNRGFEHILLFSSCSKFEPPNPMEAAFLVLGLVGSPFVISFSSLMMILIIEESHHHPNQLYTNRNQY